MTNNPLPRLMVIDLGSNSFHGAVYELQQNNQLQKLDSLKEQLCFAEIVAESGSLNQKDIQKAIQVLKAIQDMAKQYQAPIFAVGTHAIRSADNYDEFINEVRTATGIEVHIVDAHEEARLSYLGISLGLAKSHQPFLGIDLGGGSSEIYVGSDQGLSYVTSLGLGTVSITKRFLSSKSPSKRQLKAAQSFLLSRILPLSFELRAKAYGHGIAPSGTGKALAQMDHWLKEKSPLLDPHGYRLSKEAIAHLESQLAKLWNPKAISEAFPIDKDRAHLILAGALLMGAYSELFGIDEWIISTSGLREGVAFDYFHRHYHSRLQSVTDLRWESVLQFGERFGIDAAKATRMSQVSAQVFEALWPYFDQELGSFEKNDLSFLVKAAAYLADVGKVLNHPQFHKHSYYMIAHAHLPGFSHRERHLIALMTRYHRKKIAKARHDKPYLQTNLFAVNFAASCLRLARHFTRHPKTMIKSLEVRPESRALTICAVLSLAQSDHSGIVNDAKKTQAMELEVLAREQPTLQKALKIPIEFEIGVQTV